MSAGAILNLSAILALTAAMVLAGTRPSAQSGPPAVRNVAGLMSGAPGGTYIQMAADMAFVIDDLENESFRLVPQVGVGSVQNMKDLLMLRGVDLAMVQHDALAQLFAIGGDLRARASDIRYVTLLHSEEVHVIVRHAQFPTSAGDLRELDGKKVVVGPKGSGHALTASWLNVVGNFSRPFEEVNRDLGPGLEALAKGEVDALIYVSGKPVEAFRSWSSRYPNTFAFLPVDHASYRGGYVRITG